MKNNKSSNSLNIVSVVLGVNADIDKFIIIK